MKKNLLLSFLMVLTVASYGQNLKNVQLYDHNGFLGMTEGFVGVIQKPDRFSLIIDSPEQNGSPKGFTAMKGTSTIEGAADERMDDGTEFKNGRIISDSTRSSRLYFYVWHIDDNNEKFLIFEKDEKSEILWFAVLDQEGMKTFNRAVWEAQQKGIIKETLSKDDIDRFLYLFDL